MDNGLSVDKKKKGISPREKKNLVFYISLIAYPLLQFIVFYIYVNFNSVKLAFFSYQPKVGTIGYTSVFEGFKHFSVAFEILTTKNYLILNSLKYFGITLCTGFPLAVLFSFYIYKKYPLSGFFKVVLFMPQIISGLILSILFVRIMNDVYPQVVYAISGKEVADPMVPQSSSYGLVVFFNVWISFGVNVMMISNAMSGINNDVIEAAGLDGANILQEFWYIVLPSIYGTLTSLLIIMMTGIFTDQMNLYNLYADRAEHFGTLGYYLYRNTINLTMVNANATPSISDLSAVGVILTLIMVPVTLGSRKLFDRFGPSEEREGKSYA